MPRAPVVVVVAPLASHGHLGRPRERARAPVPLDRRALSLDNRNRQHSQRPLLVEAHLEGLAPPRLLGVVHLGVRRLCRLPAEVAGPLEVQLLLLLLLPPQALVKSHQPGAACRLQ